MRHLVCLVVSASVLLPTTAVFADPWDTTDTVTVRNDQQLRDVLSPRVPPGATLLLAPGRYAGGIIVAEARGAEGKPITIGAADPKNPPVVAGGAVGMLVRNPAHLLVRDLVFEGATGNSMNVDDGGSMTLSARSVTLRNLRFRAMAGKGNADALKLSGLDRFAVEDCTFEDWGNGGSGVDMVGCHNGRVAGCTFRQKVKANGSNGVQAKGGSTGVVIERCAFEDAGERSVNIGGSTGMKFFRPQPPAGFEAKDVTVRHCSFKGSLSAINFVGVDGAVVEDCSIDRPTKWVIRILQETRDPAFVPCRNGAFRRNKVTFRSDEVREVVNVGPGTSPESFAFEANRWLCEDAPARSKPRLPTVEKDGVYGK